MGQPPRPQGQVGPKPQLGPPEPFLATTSLDPKVTKNVMDTILAINPIGPNFGHGPPWTNSSAMASGNHQRPPDQLSPSFPSTPGDFFLSFIPSVLKVAGMVHIWYYIPLCTIFAQKSNGDVFRTQFHLSNSRSQIPTPFRRRINQLISLTSYGGNQKTLQGSQPPVSAGVGLVQFIQDYSRAILKRYYIISISCQGIKYSILLGQLNSSIQASFNQPVWSWPNWAIPYSTV
ncbi:hypothetical protein O181_108743 [Austropuccinia psidii MF-1]|uniref:Uncharacterized protein n=1 Tax=Austropuccinia psidii MF-1 TaxID=1389203 RepID=A0A9Q3PP49_9BASI|nr:hypothetical protein [Austropuccinia psidii MF-1]